MMFIFFVYIKNTACLLFTVMRRERRWFVLKEGERLKLEGETENMGVCTKEREGHDSRGTHRGGGFMFLLMMAKRCDKE